MLKSFPNLCFSCNWVMFPANPNRRIKPCLIAISPQTPTRQITNVNLMVGVRI